MAKAGTSAEFERKNRPFAAPKEGTIPTMGQQWAYAARRYSKYQGYAWSGVAVVAGLALLGNLVASKPSEKK